MSNEITSEILLGFKGRLENHPVYEAVATVERLLNSLCAADAAKSREAIEAANIAVAARIDLWDGVLAAIQSATAVRH